MKEEEKHKYMHFIWLSFFYLNSWLHHPTISNHNVNCEIII